MDSVSNSEYSAMCDKKYIRNEANKELCSFMSVQMQEDLSGDVQFTFKHYTEKLIPPEYSLNVMAL